MCRQNDYGRAARDICQCTWCVVVPVGRSLSLHFCQQPKEVRLMHFQRFRYMVKSHTVGVSNISQRAYSEVCEGAQVYISDVNFPKYSDTIMKQFVSTFSISMNFLFSLCQRGQAQGLPKYAYFIDHVHFVQI